jgi:hypothetical protein
MQRAAALDPSSISRRKACSDGNPGSSRVTNLEQTKNPRVVILSLWRNVPRLIAARGTVRDLGPSCGQPATRGTHGTGGEVIARGNLVDRPSGGGPTRWWRLGILSLARVAGPRVQRGRRRWKPEAEAGRPLAEALALDPQGQFLTGERPEYTQGFRCLAPHLLVAGLYLGMRRDEIARGDRRVRR